MKELENKTQRAHFGAQPDYSFLHLTEESLYSVPVSWCCHRPPSARVATILDRADFANTVSVETKNRPVGRFFNSFSIAMLYLLLCHP